MNILVVTNMYPSPGDETWRGIFVKDQVDTLSSLYPDLCFDILHIKGSISNGGSNLNYVKGLCRYLVMHNNRKYDIVWAHHSFCVFLAAIYRKVPLIYTVHEGVLTNSLKFNIVNKATELSNCALYVNKSSFESSKHRNKFFLPSGIDIEQFRYIKKTECRTHLGLDQHKYYVFFPASPKRPEKNADFAYSFIEKHTTWLASENIEFLFGGDIKYELMPTWMNAVDCLVSFSEFESDGVVFKEAMACNLPVITFNVGNASTYLKDELAGSIIDRNHDFLKEKIAYWKNTGKSTGRDYLLSLEMDRHSVAHKLKKIFEEIVYGKN